MRAHTHRLPTLSHSTRTPFATMDVRLIRYSCSMNPLRAQAVCARVVTRRGAPRSKEKLGTAGVTVPIKANRNRPAAGLLRSSRSGFNLQAACVPPVRCRGSCGEGPCAGGPIRYYTSMRPLRISAIARHIPRRRGATLGPPSVTLGLPVASMGPYLEPQVGRPPAPVAPSGRHLPAAVY